MLILFNSAIQNFLSAPCHAPHFIKQTKQFSFNIFGEKKTHVVPVRLECSMRMLGFVFGRFFSLRLDEMLVYGTLAKRQCAAFSLQVLKLLNLAAPKAAPGLLINHSRVKLYSRRLLGGGGGRGRRSLLDPGREVGASRLDDLGPWGAWLVILVAVVRGGAAVTAAVAVLVLAHVHNDAGGGGRGRVELVLLP